MSEKINLNLSNLSDFKINAIKLKILRNECPWLHLYEKPYIGTEEIRQYTYCKRKVYFRHVLKGPMLQTYKMKLGTEIHEQFQKKIEVSKKQVQKYYNMYLIDEELGLVGLLDYFEFDGKEAYPVEIKSGNIPPEGLENPDKMQVTAQAILIEKNFDFLVKNVKVFYIKHDKIIDYPIDMEHKLTVIKHVREIQDILLNEKIPKATTNDAKCLDCECLKYCKGGMI